MSRYIDADAQLTKLPNDLPYKASVKRVLIQAPTADVVEVRHGEWVFSKLGGRDAWVCSLCGAGFTGENAEWIAKEHNFCPKCGAKMDGERKENGK